MEFGDVKKVALRSLSLGISQTVKNLGYFGIHPSIFFCIFFFFLQFI